MDAIYLLALCVVGSAVCILGVAGAIYGIINLRHLLNGGREQ